MGEEGVAATVAAAKAAMPLAAAPAKAAAADAAADRDTAAAADTGADAAAAAVVQQPPLLRALGRAASSALTATESPGRSTPPKSYPLVVVPQPRVFASAAALLQHLGVASGPSLPLSVAVRRVRVPFVALQAADTLTVMSEVLAPHTTISSLIKAAAAPASGTSSRCLSSSSSTVGNTISTPTDSSMSSILGSGASTPPLTLDGPDGRAAAPPAAARDGAAAPPAELEGSSAPFPFPFPRTVVPCWADDAEAYELEFEWRVPVYLAAAPQDEPAGDGEEAQPSWRPLAAAGWEKYHTTTMSSSSSNGNGSLWQPAGGTAGPRGCGTARWTAERSQQYAPTTASTPTATINSSNLGGGKWAVLDGAALDGSDCGWSIAAYTPAPPGRAWQAPAVAERRHSHNQQPGGRW
jgi:hypothetical protein